MNRLSEGIAGSLTSTSSILPEPFGSELKSDLLMAEGNRVAVGLASLNKVSHNPYGRRFPVPKRRDCSVFSEHVFVCKGISLMGWPPFLGALTLASVSNVDLTGNRSLNGLC